MCGEVKVRIYAFLALTLFESDIIWTPVATHRETAPDTTGCEDVWIGQLLGMVAKRKIPAPAGSSIPLTLLVSPKLSELIKFLLFKKIVTFHVALFLHVLKVLIVSRAKLLMLWCENKPTSPDLLEISALWTFWQILIYLVVSVLLPCIPF